VPVPSRSASRTRVGWKRSGRSSRGQASITIWAPKRPWPWLGQYTTWLWPMRTRSCKPSPVMSARNTLLCTPPKISAGPRLGSSGSGMRWAAPQPCLPRLGYHTR
jgi:hypothetical protein